MTRNNKKLYEKIIRSVSKLLKHILNEDIYYFDVTDYNDEDHDMIDQNTIENIISVLDAKGTNILWNDLNVYTLYDIIDGVPLSGYPIGVNIIDNKYVSLKYVADMSTGHKSSCKQFFSFKDSNKAPNVKFHNNIITDYSIKDLLVELKHNKKFVYYKSMNNKKIINNFNYFDGKKQTLLILDDIENKNDYPVIENIYKFNPGNTKRGDWYLPEIGELVLIYALKPVIDYICKILKENGYTDIYNEIEKVWYWSSTFRDSKTIYAINMLDHATHAVLKDLYLYGNLAMYQLKDY